MAHALPTSLLPHWTHFIRAWGVADPAPAWELICRRYGEAHRHYHGFAHLEDLLTLAAAREWEDPLRVQAVIWWHDLIYDPWRRDNEARSAAQAGRDLRAWRLPSGTCDWVERVILATATHQPQTGHLDELAFLDLDLAVLAWPAAAYDAYAQAIRREYRHVPGLLYRRGRRQVLAGFLDRPFLYHTEAGRRDWEAAARANLQREISRL